MYKYCQVTGDYNNVIYRKCIENIGRDGYFVNHRNASGFKPTTLEFIASNQLNTLTFEDIVRKGINSPAKILLINEVFMDNGELRNWRVKKDHGVSWIKDVVKEIKMNRSTKEIWLTDMRPRGLEKWQKIREYVETYQPDIDGIGVQVHFDIGRGIVPDWLTSKLVLQYVELQTKLNRKYGKVAFSEVSVLPGELENVNKIGKIYNQIDRLAERLMIDWICYWSPTDLETWHWDKNRRFPCGIYNLEGNDRRKV